MTQETLASIDLFSELSKAEIRAIEKLMTPITIKAGRTFITEGAVGREAFIMLEGTATVRRKGRLVSTVGPGEVIGEMSLVSNSHRLATVTAETDVIAEVLNRREFISLLDQNAKISRKLMVSAIRRLHELEPALLS